MATDIGGPSPGGAAADAMILRCPHPIRGLFGQEMRRGPWRHTAPNRLGIASCVTQLASRQHAIRAAAIIADVRLPDHGAAIEVSLEHARARRCASSCP